MDFQQSFHEMAGSFQEFYQEVREGVELKDVLLISVVPVVLTIVFLLPQQVQQGLMLDFQSPRVFNLFSYALVHRGLNHFTGNLVNYVFLVTPAYLLCVLAREKRFFRYTWLSFVLLFPIVIAVIELISPVAPNTSAGFSGVDSAFLGFLPISLVLFLRNRISKQIQVAHAVVLFLLAASTISFTYSGLSGLTLGAFSAAVILAAFYTYNTGAGEFRKVFTELASMQGYIQLALFALLLFLASPIIAFPANISRGTGAVDIFAHYLGLILGFFLPYIYLMYRDIEFGESLPKLS